MLKLLIKVTTLFATAIVFNSCSSRITDFTLISTKNIDYSKGGKYERLKVKVVGSDKKRIIIFFANGLPNIKQAVDNALDQIPDSYALADGVINQKGWYIPFIYGVDEIEVIGTPLVYRKQY